MPHTPRDARWYRSMLFVPGHKLDWMLKAPKYGADGLIHLLEDVLAVVRPGVDGLMLPKTEGPADVAALDLLLSELEATRGMPAGGIEIAPLAESAIAIYRLYDIVTASPRVKRAGVIGGTGNGDSARALGITLNESGDEGLYFDAHQVLQARAAGLTQVWGGMVARIDDLDLVRRVATRARRMGGTGAMAIHPSHVPILNEVYGPSAEEISLARETVAAMREAAARGDAAARVRGSMVDHAHGAAAAELLERARSMGIDVGEVPELADPPTA